MAACFVFESETVSLSDIAPDDGAAHDGGGDEQHVDRTGRLACTTRA